MSNITRYTCVANDHDAMVSNPDGEYVRFDYANLRIEMLEQQNGGLEDRVLQLTSDRDYLSKQNDELRNELEKLQTRLSKYEACEVHLEDAIRALGE